MKSITILQTPIRFFPYIGGVENHVYYLSKELIKLGNNVKVICANEPVSNLKMVEGVKIDRLNYKFKITNTNITLSLPFKIISSHFDIIHTHMPTPWTSDWSIFIAKLMKKKSLITIHNDMDKFSFMGKLLTKIYLYTIFQITLSLVDKIIIVNPNWNKTFSATKSILNKFNNKIIIIKNGIDLNIFKPNLSIKKSENLLLFVSILDKHHTYKGLDYLLIALRNLKKHNPKIKLMIIGDGELKNYYKNKIKSLNLTHNVIFKGEIKQNKLAYYYNKASLFILPSTEIEGFGIVLLEAMACKLPVIATDIVGISNDIIKYKAGVIIKPKSSKKIENGIRKLLINKNVLNQMGENGRRLIESKYSWRNVSNQIYQIYLSLL